MPARRALDLARNSSVSRRRWTIEQSYTDERGPARSAPHLLTGKCIIFGRSGRKTAQKANCGATTGSAPRHFFRTVTLPEVRGGTRRPQRTISEGTKDRRGCPLARCRPVRLSRRADLSMIRMSGRVPASRGPIDPCRCVELEARLPPCPPTAPHRGRVKTWREAQAGSERDEDATRKS